MTKNDLFTYLDGFNFFSQSEVIKAVCEFIKENWELIDVENSIFWKRVYIWSLADDYISEKQLFHLSDFLD